MAYLYKREDHSFCEQINLLWLFGPFFIFMSLLVSDYDEYKYRVIVRCFFLLLLFLFLSFFSNFTKHTDCCQVRFYNKKNIQKYK